MDTIRYRIFPENGKILEDEPIKIDTEIINDFINWRFIVTIKDVLQTHGTNPEGLIFLYINEDLPNHREICETILKIAKETL